MPNLPGESVYIEKTDTEVYVHPIVHTSPVNPLYRPGEKMRTYVQESVDVYLSEGAEVYMEQGLPEDFGVDDRPVHELHDQEWAEEAYPQLWEENEESLKWDRRKNLAYTLTMPLQAPRVMAQGIRESLFGKSDEQKEREERRAKERAYLTDPDALEEYETELRETTLPEPLRRDLMWEREPERAVVVTERSRHIAEHIVENAEPGEMHVVVGGAHYTGVLHWLQEYSSGVGRTVEETPEAHRLAEGYLKLDEEGDEA